jgi:hypothetical protein
MSIMLEPVLDRVIVRQQLKPEHFCEQLSMLELLAQTKGLKITYPQKGIGKVCHLTHKKVGVQATISVHSYHGKAFIRYNYKPGEVGTSGIDALKQISSFYFGWAKEMSADLDAAVDRGRISYAEVATDYPWKASDDLLVHLMQSASSARFIDGAQLGTQYSGGRESAHQLSCYDKSLERWQKGQPWPFAQTFRIEMRLRTKMTSAEVIALNHPYSRVRVYSLSKAASLSTEKPAAWSAFLACARVSGVAAALTNLGGTHGHYKRQRLLQLLSQCQVDWFDPNLFSKNWPATTAVALGITPRIVELAPMDVCNQLHSVYDAKPTVALTGLTVATTALQRVNGVSSSSPHH